jgi:hypothetical protein
MIVSIALTHARHSARGRRSARRQQQAPLLGVGIDGDLQRAERLDSPEHEPRLARILAHVARWEALDEVAHEERQVRLLVQDQFDVVERDFVLQYVFSVGLQVGRFGWVRIDRRWTRRHACERFRV